LPKKHDLHLATSLSNYILKFKFKCIKHAFLVFLDYGFNGGNFGLNAAFNIEILINRIKI